MWECKKDETVIENPPPPLADLQCLSSPHVKEAKGERIQIGFREMVGSASYRLHA